MNAFESMFSMRGRTVLVTGATGHLGRQVALAFAAAGARVLVNARSADAVADLVGAIRASGGEATPFAFDITDADAVRRMLRSLEGPLHALVNNAYVGGSGRLEGADPQAYRESYEVAVVGADGLLQAALPALRLAAKGQGGASIVNIASMDGTVSPDQRVYDSPSGANPPFYGAAKAALIQWTRYAACEFGPQGIRVNSVSPGPFPSESVQLAAPDFVARLAAKVPMGRIGAAIEISGPVVFLASPASSYVNGANLVVDGGWTAW